MRMRLSLKTKFTLTTALLVLAVVAVTSTVYLATLTRNVIRGTDDRAQFIALQLIRQAEHVLADAAKEGASPASESPDSLREYLRVTLSQSVELNSAIDAIVGDAPWIYEVTVVDADGTALVSSDSMLRGQKVLRRTPLRQLASKSLVQEFRALYTPLEVYQVTFPFGLKGRAAPENFGEIRVAVQVGQLRAQIDQSVRRAAWFGLGAVLFSTVLAAVLSQFTLAPLKRISVQLDRISAGEFDTGLEKELPPGAASGDELTQVSTKVAKIGQQLRGVREIFSTLRENLNQIMAGLEDGLLLFTPDGRAVLVSPAAEKFLGAPADSLLGRPAEEIFPPGHPLRQALRFQGGELLPVAAAEVQLDGADGAGTVRRVGLSVQVIHEGGARMGALVTLRDLESLERISTQLQVSERLAALGRVTAGVAHEVKNPLNSMRLWLENLKENLPAGQELPQQAVKVLDSEIDRLDSVVRRFLDFTRPVELRLEETSLAELLAEVVSNARPQIDRAGVEAKIELPAGVPPVNVDRQLIKQAILNLVLNAVEAMPGGGRLSVTLARRGDMAEVSVADTGCGIAPENREKIFQLFFSKKPGGSGIGLAIAYKIVQLHNGSIDFESEVDHGTTFRIELPLAA